MEKLYGEFVRYIITSFKSLVNLNQNFLHKQGK